MADGFAQLDAMIAKMRALGTMTKDAAPDVAAAFEAELRGLLAGGQSPDGAPWQPTKAGTQPLKGAPGAVYVRAVGTVVLARLSGHHVFHHYGTSKDPRRRILPVRGLPASLGAAIKAGLVKWWGQEMAS